jgi:hypothetical protein
MMEEYYNLHCLLVKPGARIRYLIQSMSVELTQDPLTDVGECKAKHIGLFLS